MSKEDDQKIGPQKIGPQKIGTEGEIGRITPKKVARAMTPLEQEALRKQREEYYSGKNVSGRLLPEDEVHSDEELETKPERSTEIAESSDDTILDSDTEVQQDVSNSKIRLFSYLILLACLALGIVIFVMLIPRVFNKNPQSEVIIADPYEHLQINQKPIEQLDLSDALGVLHIGDKPYALKTAEAKLYAEESLVEILLFEDSKSNSPLIRIEFVFEKNSSEVSVDSLKEYTLIKSSGEVPFVLSKEYVRRLADHQEVSELSGELKVGKLFRAALKDSRVDSTTGNEISWDLRIEARFADAL